MVDVLTIVGDTSKGERQPWATPRPPPVRVVNGNDLGEGSVKPYGTFPAQSNFDSYALPNDYCIAAPQLPSDAKVSAADKKEDSK